MRRSLILAALAALGLASGPARAAETIDPDLLAGLTARPIGPATMSGRLPALDVVESNPDLMYAGGAAGGVWKAGNRGRPPEPVVGEPPAGPHGAPPRHHPQPPTLLGGTPRGETRQHGAVGP